MHNSNIRFEIKNEKELFMEVFHYHNKFFREIMLTKLTNFYLMDYFTEMIFKIY